MMPAKLDLLAHQRMNSRCLCFNSIQSRTLNLYLQTRRTGPAVKLGCFL
jgi:hypothetical protein